MTPQRDTVFILERDERERSAMREVILRADCAVVDAPSAGDLLPLLRRSGAACDLIVLAADAVDDPALYDQIVSARTPAPDVILYGANPEAKAVLHALNNGAVDFLAKPVPEDELVRAVEHALFKDPDETDGTGAGLRATSHVTGWVELTAGSEPELFRRIQRFSDALFATRLPNDVCEDLRMAVEEVGRNAVEWGNRFDPDKRVHINYCIFDDRVVIKVEDEGDGFVPANIPDPTANPVQTMKDRASAGKRPGGYGVFLIQKLMDEIFYSEKGNTVLLVKHLPQTGS